MEDLKNQEVKKIDENLQKIEDARKLFLSKSKKHESLKRVILLIFFLVAVAALILGGKFSNSIAIQFGVPILCVIGMFVFLTLTKKSTVNKLHEYLRLYYSSLNSYVFSGKNYKNVTLQTPWKISNEEFIECGLYKSVWEVNSRGLTTFEFKNRNYSIVECAAQFKGDKRAQLAFVGKYLVSESSYKKVEPIIIYLKGTGTVLPPSNVDNLKKVVDNDKLTVFTNNSKWEQVINEPIMKKINSIKTNNLLVDFTLCVRDSKCFACMGYDDPVMIPPYDKELNEEPYKQFKKDLEKTIDLMEAFK